MKIIEFALSEKDHFELLYETLLASSGIKAMEARLFHSICTKFEANSTFKDNSPLKTIWTSVRIDLEDAEHALMMRLINSVEFTAHGARKAAETLQWLESQVK